MLASPTHEAILVVFRLYLWLPILQLLLGPLLSRGHRILAVGIQSAGAIVDKKHCLLK